MHEGKLKHSELEFGEDGLIMVVGTSTGGKTQGMSPKTINGGNTQSLFIYVDDIEAHYQKSKQVQAKILSELATTDYGAEYWADRGYGAEDPEGHCFWFAQRIRG